MSIAKVGRRYGPAGCATMAGPTSATCFEFFDAQGLRVVLTAHDRQLTLTKEGVEVSWIGLDEATRSYSTSGGNGLVPSHAMTDLISFLQSHGAWTCMSDFPEVSGGGIQETNESIACDVPQAPIQPEPCRASADEDAKRQQHARVEASVSQSSQSENSMSQGERLEALMEQQNALLMRQLEVAEKAAAKQSSASWQGKSTQDLLKPLDAQSKAIFVQWRRDFRATVATYVAQSKRCSKLQTASANGELVPPFSREACRSWDWPQCYCTVAQRLPGDGQSNDSNAALAKSEFPNPTGDVDAFDVCQAFAKLRHEHAADLQNFVLGHQEACVRNILQDLSLDSQVSKLQEQIAASIPEGNATHTLGMTRQTVTLQAQAFVEAVHSSEMQAAEKKLKEKLECPAQVLFGLRIAITLVVVTAISIMSHEVLMHLVAFFFALGCGLALLWEDVAASSLKLLLGSSIKRWESAYWKSAVAQSSQIQVNLPIPSM